MALVFAQALVGIHQGFIKGVTWLEVTAHSRTAVMKIGLGIQSGHGIASKSDQSLAKLEKP
jgi:flagellar biosynthesis protein FliR